MEPYEHTELLFHKVFNIFVENDCVEKTSLLTTKRTKSGTMAQENGEPTL
jgi:hypothetical protein